MRDAVTYQGRLYTNDRSIHKGIERGGLQDKHRGGRGEVSIRELRGVKVGRAINHYRRSIHKGIESFPSPSRSYYLIKPEVSIRELRDFEVKQDNNGDWKYP